jgi:K+-transporting ATPase ATPase C chain
MIKNAFRGLGAAIVLGVLTGLLYPLVITGLAQATFGSKAEGSLIRVDGQVLGSSSIGQPWEGEEWFHSRPSAVDYDASVSSGSNLGPTSQDLATLIEERVQGILALEGTYDSGLSAADIPVDLLTASASGLDPDITPEAARFQAPRVAAVRGLSLDTVLDLIDEHIEARELGLFGEPRVNVLELNLALERAAER